MNRILLIANDWRARALLRAQLLEEGVDVEAWATVAEALKSAAIRPRIHRLIVADLHASANPVGELAALERWSRAVPVWIIASRSTIGEHEVRGRSFERVLFRPVDLGRLVSEIKLKLTL